MNRKTASKIPALLVSAALIAAPVMTFAQTTTTEPAAPEATTPAPEATTPEVMPAPADTTTAPAATDPAVAAEPAATASAYVIPEGYVAVTDMTMLTADTLKGVDVVDNAGADVGEVSDVELSAEGAVTGIILDIGGFLGMGEHTVKLSLDQITIYADADKDMIVNVPMDKAALEALPEYEAPAG